MYKRQLEYQRGLSGDAKAFIEADRDFHALLIAASGNEVLEDMYEGLRVRHVLIGLTAVRRPGARLEDVLVEHEAILAGLEAGDPEQTDAAIEAHLDATRRRLVGGLSLIHI